MDVQCYKCLKSFDYDLRDIVSRREECAHCHTDVRCCKMCKFYDAQSYNECRESNAGRVVNKEKSNFCDYFELNPTPGASNKGDLLSAAEALFKK